MTDRPQTALITGFPRLLARGLAQRCLNRGDAHRAWLLIQPDQRAAAEAFAADLPPAQRARLRLFEGSLDDIDLGLPGAEVNSLLTEVTLLFHADREHGASRAPSRANLRRLHALLELARDVTRLERVALFSTAFVSGDRSGVIDEEDLDCGQRLRTPFEHAMFAMEQMARLAMPRLPITVLRPGAMIGHSRTGDSSGLTDGPNYLVNLLIRLPAEVPMLLPGTGGVPFNIVPIDYVVRAAWELALRPEAAGRTFHLTDPNPVSTRQAFELISTLVNRSAPFAGLLPARLIRRALKVARLDRLAPQKVALLEDLNRNVIYRCAGTLELLADTDVVCPAFESYADALVAWMATYERAVRAARGPSPATADPASGATR